jgi:hypothetical protein
VDHELAGSASVEVVGVNPLGPGVHPLPHQHADEADLAPRAQTHPDRDVLEAPVEPLGDVHPPAERLCDRGREIAAGELLRSGVHRQVSV